MSMLRLQLQRIKNMFWFICLVFVFSFLLVASKRDVEKGCWPNNVIPYRIDNNFSQEQKQVIKRHIGELHRLTCVRWLNIDELGLKVTDSAIFVKTTEKRCFSEGLTTDEGFVASITLADICFAGHIKTAVIHEMLHVMGFGHEHQRSDRDCYVKVYRRPVVKSGRQRQFEIVPQEEWLERFPYDKRSVMHYPRDIKIRALGERWYEFEPLGNNEAKLTYFDLWKINYRFCNTAHYCDVVPQVCKRVDKEEKDCRKNSSNFGTIDDY